ncbi:stalk domain-containing protein [Caldalkalibacillus salinus]|uniref:stalk domain-containing protein n=1 Tax=Caldalkalibacillus salinus TaxID=2803787 RepID=UPI00192168EA|nr:stalk domain-containing protein [Caldalkalibacillus salinus]
MNRKKWLLSLCGFALCGSLFLLSDRVNASLDLFLDQFYKTDVEVNGTMLNQGEVPPFIVNGRTVVPLTQAAQMLNSYTEWDESRRVAQLIKPIVNMTIINRTNQNSLEVNPTFSAGTTNTFQVATQVSGVPVSDDLRTRFVVENGSGTVVHTGNAFTIDTEQFDGSFVGNLSVANLRLSDAGQYTLKLQMEDPNNDKEFITIGEYIMIAD